MTIIGFAHFLEHFVQLPHTGYFIALQANDIFHYEAYYIRADTTLINALLQASVPSSERYSYYEFG